jgi:hypothetical protein
MSVDLKPSICEIILKIYYVSVTVCQRIILGIIVIDFIILVLKQVVLLFSSD